MYIVNTGYFISNYPEKCTVINYLTQNAISRCVSGKSKKGKSRKVASFFAFRQFFDFAAKTKTFFAL